MKSNIDILVHAPKSFSASFKKVIKHAAAQTLLLIPKSQLKKKVRASEKCTISIAIIGPQKSQKLNHQYRGKDRPTDVLSFSRMDSPATQFSWEDSDLGDVLICWKVAKRQASEYETTIKEELARLTVHGVLHLFGYDHEIGLKEQKKMFNLQDKILRSL